MMTIEKLKAEILKLSPYELARLFGQLLELDEQAWDAQIEKDAAAGKLDFLAKEALEDYEAGTYQKI